MALKILFLSYDGLTEALGQSQVLAYMKGIQSEKYKITILSFDKPAMFEKNGEKIRQECQKHHIRWVSLPYKNKPVLIAPPLMLKKAWEKIKELHKNEQFDIVHGRGGIISVLGLKLQAEYGIRFVYDMRGWWADEKLESGNWPLFIGHFAYKYFKFKEKELFQKSDYLVSLTEAGKREIVRNKWKREEDIGVVPTCTDLSLFKKSVPEKCLAVRRSLNIPSEAKVLIYSGALGGNYPVEDIFMFIKAYLDLDKTNYCLILSKDHIQMKLPERTVIKSVDYSSVSDYLSIGDSAFIYYKKAFSNIGRCPTKLGEYWACGLPVFCPEGVGDVEMIFDRFPGSGTIVRSWTETGIKEAIKKMLTQKTEPELLRKAAVKFFSLERGLDFYRSVYQKLSSEQNKF